MATDMTMILGYCFEDVAAIIADSRLYDLKLAKPVDDDHGKLVELCPTVFAGCSGYAIAVEMILERVKQADSSFPSHESLIEAIRDAAGREWPLVKNSAPSGIAPDQISVGLIVGGVLERMPFLSTIQISDEGIERSTVSSAIQCRMVSGVSDAAKTRVFNGSLREKAVWIIENVEYDRSSGPTNDTIRQLLEASGHAIRAVAAEDYTVGGSVRYVVVRNNYECIRGTI